MTRAFAAASRWLSNRGYCGYNEHRVEHVGYRCGWMAGYAAAQRDAQQHNGSEKP